MKPRVAVLAPAMVVLCAMASSAGFAQTTPQATAAYTLSVFAKAPAGLSAPDSIAVLHDHIFVGYGDGHAPDGSDGLSSQVVEYGMDGSIVHIYTLKGHNDGLKVDPITHRLWALQNEDASPRLVIINPKTQEQKLYLFGSTPHGGGYDDMVFRGCKVYISASNPANNPNTGPAIVSAHLSNGIVDVEQLLAGDASAINIPTSATTKLNLQDPDSMTLDPQGNIVLDSQGDQELIIVTNPGSSKQQALVLPLGYETSTGSQPVETDDTAFVTSSEGFILFADKGLNTVYKLSKNGFAPGVAYTAADGGPFVGTLDLSSGVVTPVVTGLVGPGGLVFVDTSDVNGDSDLRQEREADQCREQREWDSQ
jgi:hypothetical protein